MMKRILRTLDYAWERFANTARTLLPYIGIALTMAAIVFFASGGCSRNVDKVKARADEAAEQIGFEIVGYEGYTLSPVFGGCPWYTMRREGSDVVYNAKVCVWYGELHVYNLRAIDAISPTD